MLRTATMALLATLPVLAACSDSPTSPADASKPAPDADFENLSNRELLVQVLTKLNALEARVDREALAVRARVDSAIAAGVMAGALPLPVSGSADLGIEATACAAGEGEIKGRVESKVELKGEGEGSVGAEPIGDGALAKLKLLASSVASVLPGGKMNLKIEVCAKLGGGAGTGLRGAQFAFAPSSVKTSPSPLQPLLEGMLQTISQDKMAAAISALQMNGSKLNLGLDAITGLTSGDLSFGKAAAASLMDALPLPAGIRNLVADPLSVLQKAPEALQFATDRLCSQTAFPGEMATLASQACSLRGQIPSAGTVIGILQGLNGLPTTLGSLQSGLQGACAAVNGMLPARVVISPVDVSFPLGIGTVRVFPGFDRPVFPGITASC